MHAFDQSDAVAGPPSFDAPGPVADGYARKRNATTGEEATVLSVDQENDLILNLRRIRDDPDVGHAWTKGRAEDLLDDLVALIQARAGGVDETRFDYLNTTTAQLVTFASDGIVRVRVGTRVLRSPAAVDFDVTTDFLPGEGSTVGMISAYVQEDSGTPGLLAPFLSATPPPLGDRSLQHPTVPGSRLVAMFQRKFGGDIARFRPIGSRRWVLTDMTGGAIATAAGPSAETAAVAVGISTPNAIREVLLVPDLQGESAEARYWTAEQAGIAADHDYQFGLERRGAGASSERGFRSPFWIPAQSGQIAVSIRELAPGPISITSHTLRVLGWAI